MALPFYASFPVNTLVFYAAGLGGGGMSLFGGIAGTIGSFRHSRGALVAVCVVVASSVSLWTYQSILTMLLCLFRCSL
jgi:hypothetical protein